MGYLFGEIIMKIIADEYMADDIEVLDLDSGKFIEKCKWADQETGEYEIYSYSQSSGFLSEIKKGNIVLVYKGK